MATFNELVSRWLSGMTNGAAHVTAPARRSITYTNGTYNFYADAPYGSLLTQAVWHVNRYQIALPNESVDAFNVVGTEAAVLAMVHADFNGGSLA